jgi:hypothetical protein
MNMTNRRACVNAAYGNLSAAMASDTKPETPDCLLPAEHAHKTLTQNTEGGEIFMISST